MAKPVLGRGLGKLMDGDKVAGQNAPITPSEPEPRVGRGMGTLLDPAENPEAPPASLLPVWFFFAADLLLLFLTIAVCSASPKPLGFGTILFCVLTVGLGALLAILGLRRQTKRR